MKIFIATRKRVHAELLADRINSIAAMDGTPKLAEATERGLCLLEHDKQYIGLALIGEWLCCYMEEQKARQLL